MLAQQADIRTSYGNKSDRAGRCVISGIRACASVSAR